MAATTHDVMPNQMMAAAEFLEAEWDEQGEDWDPETSEYYRAFDEMCERFASGYSPKDATAFLKDLGVRCRWTGRSEPRLMQQVEAAASESE